MIVKRMLAVFVVLGIVAVEGKADSHLDLALQQEIELVYHSRSEEATPHRVELMYEFKNWEPQYLKHGISKGITEHLEVPKPSLPKSASQDRLNKGPGSASGLTFENALSEAMKLFVTWNERQYAKRKWFEKYVIGNEPSSGICQSMADNIKKVIEAQNNQSISTMTEDEWESITQMVEAHIFGHLKLTNTSDLEILALVGMTSDELGSVVSELRSKGYKGFAMLYFAARQAMRVTFLPQTGVNSAEIWVDESQFKKAILQSLQIVPGTVGG